MSEALAPIQQAVQRPLTKKNLLRQLNGVRIVASLWVVAYHYQPQIFGILPELRFLAPVTSIGYLAVDLFFVLSGFIICYQYLERFSNPSSRDYVGFLIKRLARIYPAHLAVLLALALLVVGSSVVGAKVSDPDNYSIWGFFMDLFLFRSWVGDSQGWNIPAWSLSAEWLAYVLYPLVALATVWIAKKRASVILCSAAGLIVLEGVATWIYPSSHMPVPAARIMLAFGLGCLVYLIFKRTAHSVRNGVIGIAALGALLLIPALAPSGGLRASIALLLAGFTIFFLSTASGWPMQVLGSRFFNSGGHISFSIYLAHVPALMVMVRVLSVERFDDSSLLVRGGIAFLYMAIAVMSGAFLYHFVEKPAQRWIVGALAKRRTSGSSGAGT